MKLTGKTGWRNDTVYEKGTQQGNKEKERSM